MTQWKYYNHAIIPDQAPHLPVETSKIDDGSIFDDKMGSSRAVLARWTEGWDLPQKTNFWHCIKDNLFQPDDTSKKTRYELRKAAKYFDTRILDSQKECAQIYNVHYASESNWPSKYRPQQQSYEQFYQTVCKWPSTVCTLGAFLKGSQTLVGYAKISMYATYAEFNVLRTLPKYEKYAINAALVSSVLKHVGQYWQTDFYITDGARNIFHQTHFQDYLEKYFGFRKAYCKLHIKYRPGLDKIIKMIYPFRQVFTWFDGISKIHQLNGILKMEEICRADKGVTCTD